MGDTGDAGDVVRAWHAPSCDPHVDNASIACVADALGRAYVRSVSAREQGNGVVADVRTGLGLGNYLHIVGLNLLLAVASKRRLVIESSAVRALFQPPAHLSPDDLYPACHRTVCRTKHAPFFDGSTSCQQIRQLLATKHNLRMGWWFFQCMPPYIGPLAPLGDALRAAGARPADMARADFLAAVAHSWLYQSLTPSAARRVAVHAAAVRGACQAALPPPGVVRPWLARLAPSSAAVDIVIHLRTWSEDAQCSLRRADRFNSSAPTECGACMSRAARECVAEAVRQHVALARDKASGPLCALVLSDSRSLARDMQQRLSTDISMLAAVSEYSIAYPPWMGSNPRSHVLSPRTAYAHRALRTPTAHCLRSTAHCLRRSLSGA